MPPLAPVTRATLPSSSIISSVRRSGPSLVLRRRGAAGPQQYPERLASDPPAETSPPQNPPPPNAPPPEPHPSAWKVAPAPDGRGAPPKPKPPMIPRSRTFIAFLLGLLAVNLLISVLTSGAPSHPQVPYQPFFVN